MVEPTRPPGQQPSPTTGQDAGYDEPPAALEPVPTDDPDQPPAEAEPPAGSWAALSAGGPRQLAVTLAVAALATMAFLWAFHALSSFLFLLMLAWLASIAMEPVVLWMIHHGIKRRLASGLTVILLLLFFAAIGAVFGQLFAAQLGELEQALPGAITSALDWVNSTFKTNINVATIAQSINLTPDKITQLAQSYGGGLIGIFGSLLAFVFDTVTLLVFAYYLSADSVSLRKTIGSFLPPRAQPVFVTMWTIAVQKTGGFVVSKIALALISAAAHAVFFWAISVPYWLPLGLVVGVVGQFIPTIGTYIGVLLPALFALLQRPILALWIVLFATVYQQIENYVLTPRISQKTLDVHPAVALAAVFVGVGLFGPIGAIIGIPIAAAVLAVVDTFRHRQVLGPGLADLAEAEERVLAAARVSPDPQRPRPARRGG